MRGQSFIFLAGLHRSGTSLLHRIIRDHPQVTGLSGTDVPEDEGQHVQSVYPNGIFLGGPGKFAFNPHAYMDETHPLVSEENARKILQEWSQYLDLPNQYVVEKSPTNILRSRFLQALYPNSRFVFILRHPLAVSYATQKWSKTSINQLMEHWLKAYDIFLQDLPHLNSVYLIRYENFVADPRGQSESLFGFLGLPTIPVTQAVKLNVNKKYFKKWYWDQHKKYWRRSSSKQEIPEGMEERIRKFGYSLETPETLYPLSFYRGIEMP